MEPSFIVEMGEKLNGSSFLGIGFQVWKKNTKLNQNSIVLRKQWNHTNICPFEVQSCNYDTIYPWKVLFRYKYNPASTTTPTAIAIGSAFLFQVNHHEMSL